MARTRTSSSRPPSLCSDQSAAVRLVGKPVQGCGPQALISRYPKSQVPRKGPWKPTGQCGRKRPRCKKEGHCLRERTPAVPNLQSRRMQYQSVHEVASVWGVGEEVNLMVRAFASESASHEITRSFTQVASAPGPIGHLTSGRHPDRLRGSPSRSFYGEAKCKSAEEGGRGPEGSWGDCLASHQSPRSGGWSPDWSLRQSHLWWPWAHPPFPYSPTLEPHYPAGALSE